MFLLLFESDDSLIIFLKF